MLLTLRLTEERKRFSSVTAQCAPHADLDKAPGNPIVTTHDRFLTPPRAGVSCCAPAHAVKATAAS
ncbi:hypothetical protein AWC06_14525 [Mycobacterium fragae]|uniref:Uncharacterized protein n=1 Tax=Mycobacterium fragae TaxID=1260918 RepID=A0A1X1UUM5_9MYCO|nr:hypothetical protein AWC06_14525 [Mycobacterium fragae]